VQSANANPTPKAREVCVEIVVTGRNVEVPDHFRVHVAEKVARLERYDHKIVGLEVELFHERNRRQLKSCQRVELTGRGCGPVARAEACAQDFYAALDAAVAKLEARLRRSHDRRRVTGRRTRVPAGIGAGGTAVLDELPALLIEPDSTTDSDNGSDRDIDADSADIPGPRDHGEYLPDDDDPAPGRVVRRKVHTASPMSVDDALSRMELVGHDFYLFADADSGEPSVVYRRKGYDYGVIRLSE
jgi:ribosomal subunit interface protein